MLPTRLNVLSTTVEGLVVYCLEFFYGNCWSLTVDLFSLFLQSVQICSIHFIVYENQGSAGPKDCP